MSIRFKGVLFLTMTIALACGFMHHLIPAEQLNFERLHIFLFNLCSGGTLLLYVTENNEKVSLKVKTFFLLSYCFAFASFLEFYPAALILPLILGAIVESVRVQQFGSIFPKEIFLPSVKVARKFHQAALLCLSMGLFMCSPVILNDVYTQWITIKKLKLDTFFLGFSFPLSLVSMAVIFSLMKEETIAFVKKMKEVSFWIINLGVIVFFLFILGNVYVPQVLISLTLFLAVAYILYLYVHEGVNLQQKAFLTSGMFFLLVTSITGIVYIFYANSGEYETIRSMALLRVHSFTALYGWNLSGLVVISRYEDFPIQLHSQKVISLHWLTVFVLCPVGYFYPAMSFIAVLGYCWLLYILFFTKGTQYGSGVWG